MKLKTISVLPSFFFFFFSRARTALIQRLDDSNETNLRESDLKKKNSYIYMSSVRLRAKIRDGMSSSQRQLIIHRYSYF